MSCRPKSFRSRAALRSGTMAGSFSRPAADQIWSSVPSTLRSHQAVTLLSAASTRSVLRMPRRPSENMTALTGISCGRSSPVMVCGFRSREVCVLIGMAGSLVWLKTRSSRSISRLEIASEQFVKLRGLNGQAVILFP